MTNGKQKGKRGELEFSRLCREYGWEVRRTAQYCGNTGEAADVVGLPGVHVEVKRVEKLNIYDGVNQMKRDRDKRDPNLLGIVAHRKNNHEWLITMTAKDWFKLFQEYSDGSNQHD